MRNRPQRQRSAFSVLRAVSERAQTAAEKCCIYFGLECGLVENWNKTSSEGAESTQTSYKGRYSGRPPPALGVEMRVQFHAYTRQV